MLKKVLFVILSLLLVVGIVACGGRSSINSSDDGFNAILRLQIQNCNTIVDYAENTWVDKMDCIQFGFDSKGEPIEWIILEKRGNKALLLSKNLLEQKEYNDKHVDTNWKKCSCRKWLNTDFMKQTFSKDDQNSILTTDVINNDNSEYGTKGGSNTKDKIFLLSIDEFKQYFNGYEKALVRYKNKGVGSWWVRSPGFLNSSAAYVLSNADLMTIGKLVTDKLGIRPALWVKY